MIMKNFFYFFFVLISSSYAMYDGSSSVINLTPKNFADEVFGDEHIWLVEFYAPWCGHCKNLKPVWEKLADNLKGIVKIGAVDADQHRDIGQQFGVTGFPTIKFFGHKQKENKGRVTKDAEDYNGQRTAGAFAKFATSKLPNFVESVATKNEEDFLSKEPELANALLFTDKAKTADLFKALAVDFHHQITIGQAKHTDKALVEKYGIEKFPTLLVIKEGEEPVKFEGKIKHESLFKFLKPFAKIPPGSEKKKSSSPPPPPPEPTYLEGVQVPTTRKEYEELCGADATGNCVIALLDPIEDNHQKILDTLDAVAKTNFKYFKFLWIDGSNQFGFVEELRINTGFPSMVVLNPGKKVFTQFIGAFEEKNINEYLTKILRGGKRTIPLDNLPTFSDPKNVKENKEEL